jgi:hypothetical protein
MKKISKIEEKKHVHVVFKYLSRSLLEGVGAGGKKPTPITTTLFPS